MAMNGFTKDMNIIQKLNDEPNDRDGLTAGELKAKFDEGGLAVKDYLNNTVKPHVDGMEEAADTHAADTNNPHEVTKTQVGLGNVPNVATNDQTPTYTQASSLTALTSGEKLNVAFGKIAKAINSLISHLADTVSHITAAERTAWNGKQSALTFDNSPTSGSSNPVESGGVYTALAGKFNTSGGTLTGNATIQTDSLPMVILASAEKEGVGRARTVLQKNANAEADAGTILFDYVWGPGTSTQQYVRLYLKAAASTMKELLFLSFKPETGSAVNYYLYGEHNKPTTNDVEGLEQKFEKLTELSLIRAGDDLNKLCNVGSYVTYSTAEARQILNTPGADATTKVNAGIVSFVMDVRRWNVPTAKTCSQTLRLLSGKQYYRYTNDGTVANPTWTSWVEMSIVGHTHAASAITSGTLPLERGGTGQTTAKNAASALLVSLGPATAAFQDNTLLSTSDATGETNTWYKRPATAMWNYIKSKAAAALYITAGQKSGTTLGTNATAEGEDTTASGNHASHAEGYKTTASGRYGSHAEGSVTVASGENGAHAEGDLSVASGFSGAHAEGVHAVASGEYGAHAEGHETEASGNHGAHAEGYGTKAAGETQHVFGRFNVSNTTSVEIVGWGTTTSQKNIRTLDKSGNMTIAGTLTQSSDARLKDVQGEVPDVSGIRAVRFKWNDVNGEHDDRDHIGYLAQEVEKTAPFLVGDDSNGYKSLDYIALLCAKVEMLERRVAELEGGD